MNEKPNTDINDTLASDNHETEELGGAMDYDEVYVCQVCGHEDDPDKFGKHCPICATDLDELEAEMSEGSQPYSPVPPARRGGTWT